jgi:hypothetical protein
MNHSSSEAHLHRPRLSTVRGCTALLLIAGAAGAFASCSGDDLGERIPILDHIVISPGDTTVFEGGTIHFTAVGKDAGGNDVPLEAIWIMTAGPGTLTHEGVFTAGTNAGTFPDLVRAMGGDGTVSGSATVTIEVPPP